MFNPAPVQRYALSAKGGSEWGNFYMSGEYFSQDGIFKGQGFDKYQVRFNGEIGKTMVSNVGNSLAFAHTDRQVINGSGDGFGPGNELSGIRYALITSPVFPVRNTPTAAYVNVSSDARRSRALRRRQSPTRWHLIENTDWNIKRYRVFGSVYAEITPFDGLKFRTTLGGDFLFEREKLFKERLSARSVRSNLAQRRQGVQPDARVEQHGIDFKRTFGGHRVSVLAGYGGHPEPHRLSWRIGQ
jgi:hypothetical protein